MSPSLLTGVSRRRLVDATAPLNDVADRFSDIAEFRMWNTLVTDTPAEAITLVPACLFITGVPGLLRQQLGAPRRPGVHDTRQAPPAETLLCSCLYSLRDVTCDFLAIVTALNTDVLYVVDDV